MLAEFGISWEATVSSAHRSAERTRRIVKEAEEKGTKVFICAAGMAAHLAGAVAAQTLLPVIGVPVSSGNLAGMDALFSTVQMPGGFPVATMSLDKAGAKNAAWLAAEILALGDDILRQKMIEAREKMKKEVEDAAARLKL